MQIIIVQKTTVADLEKDCQCTKKNEKIKKTKQILIKSLNVITVKSCMAQTHYHLNVYNVKNILAINV